MLTLAVAGMIDIPCCGSLGGLVRLILISFAAPVTPVTEPLVWNSMVESVVAILTSLARYA